MPLDSIDPDIEKLRELCTPGALPCAWHTAFYRVVVHDLAQGVTGWEDSHISPDTIRAEFHSLLADNLALPTCAEHAGELAAALKAIDRPAPSP